MSQSYIGKTGYIIRREGDFLFRRKKSRAFFALIYPLIAFFILLATFSSRTINKVPLAVVDNSRGSYSREFIRSLNASPYLDVKYQPQSHLEAKKLMEQGKTYAVINIDGRYDKNILDLNGGSVGAFYNNQYLLMGGNLNKAVTKTVEDLSKKYREHTLASLGVPSYVADTFIEPISVTENILYNPQMNYIYFLVLGLIPSLIQLFASLSVVYSLLYELKTGRAKEIRGIIAQHPMRIIGAKVAAYAVIYMCVLMTMLLTMFLFFDLPLRGNIIYVIIGGIAFILFNSATALVIAGCTGNLRLGLSACSAYAAPAFAYYGVTFPLEAMPFMARAWAEFLPGTHFNRILVNELMRTGAGASSIADILIMLFWAAVLLYVGSKLYARLARNEKYWGPKL